MKRGGGEVMKCIYRVLEECEEFHICLKSPIAVDGNGESIYRASRFLCRDKCPITQEEREEAARLREGGNIVEKEWR